MDNLINEKLVDVQFTQRNEKFIDVQNHREKEWLFIVKELTNFLNVSPALVDLVNKFIQTEIDRHNNATAIDSNVTLSDPDNLSVIINKS